MYPLVGPQSDWKCTMIHLKMCFLLHHASCLPSSSAPYNERVPMDFFSPITRGMVNYPTPQASVAYHSETVQMDLGVLHNHALCSVCVLLPSAFGRVLLQSLLQHTSCICLGSPRDWSRAAWVRTVRTNSLREPGTLGENQQALPLACQVVLRYPSMYIYTSQMPLMTLGWQ